MKSSGILHVEYFELYDNSPSLFYLKSSLSSCQMPMHICTHTTIGYYKHNSQACAYCNWPVLIRYSCTNITNLHTVGHFPRARVDKQLCALHVQSWESFVLEEWTNMATIVHWRVTCCVCSCQFDLIGLCGYVGVSLISLGFVGSYVPVTLL